MNYIPIGNSTRITDLSSAVALTPPNNSYDAVQICVEGESVRYTISTSSTPQTPVAGTTGFVLPVGIWILEFAFPTVYRFVEEGASATLTYIFLEERPATVHQV